ncbi:MAG: glycosyltransferase family 4 protein [Sphingobium sp.]|nr:MAG: glycosyltransferase family 4 protein [Sphingobium sp.]
MMGVFYKTPWLLRLFGGDSDIWFSDGAIKGRVCLQLVRLCPLLLVETRSLKRFFEQRGVRRCVWYPNTRVAFSEGDAANLRPRLNRCSLNLVYIGRVTETKGVFQAIEAVASLGKTASLVIFGPLECELPRELPPNVKYSGLLDSSQVTKTISNFDALLLPTFYRGEGYPGVIIEALSVGVPVISTRWRAIPELLNVRCWMLSDPGSASSLTESIGLLRQALIDEPEALAKDCVATANRFDGHVWARVFLRLCRNLSASPNYY